MTRTLVIAKSLLQRHWPIFAISIGASLLLQAVIAIAPVSDLMRQQWHSVCLTLTIIITCVFSIGAFSFGFDTDLSSPQSGFPRFKLALPARTWQLAMCPMILQGVFLGIAWAILWSLINFASRPPFYVPFWIPCVWIISGSLYIQAVAWAPLTSPLHRLAFVALLIVLLVFAGWICWSRPLQITGTLVMLSCYFASGVFLAYKAVAISRTGNTIRFPARIPRIPSVTAIFDRKEKLAGPIHALKWRIDLRMFKWLLLWGIIFAGTILWITTLQTNSNELAVVMGAVAYLNFFCSYGIATVSVSHEKQVALPSYIAALPIKSNHIVTANLQYALRTIVVTWLFCHATLILGLYLSGSLSQSNWPSLERLALLYGNGAGIRLIALATLVSLLLQLSVALTLISSGHGGRNWLNSATTIFCCAIPLLFLLTALLGFAQGPDSFIQFIISWLPTIAITAIALKLLGNIATTKWIVQHYSWSHWINAIAAWTAVAFTLSGLTLWLLPEIPTLRWPVIAIVVASLPLATTRLPYVALPWNRHR